MDGERCIYSFVLVAKSSRLSRFFSELDFTLKVIGTEVQEAPGGVTVQTVKEKPLSLPHTGLKSPSTVTVKMPLHKHLMWP